jgi:thiosulfate reductase cytochrome b subunit
MADVTLNAVDSKAQSYLYLRHRWPIRVMHWVNVIAFLVMFMSGLQIFNAHPTLNWGKSSYGNSPIILDIGARTKMGDERIGETVVFGHAFNTTGVLGRAKNGSGVWVEHAFPSWLTIPGPYSLALAREWHFFFAWIFVLNGLAYVLYSGISKHFSRDLWPTRTDMRGIWQSIKEHARFHHPQGEVARYYNVLQKLTYLIVIFGLLPLVIVMGWALSPGMNALAAGWVDLFGGRQAARSLHFIAAWALVAFMLLHVFLVIAYGFWNNMRSMITGRFRLQSTQAVAAPAQTTTAVVADQLAKQEQDDAKQ